MVEEEDATLVTHRKNWLLLAWEINGETEKNGGNVPRIGGRQKMRDGKKEERSSVELRKKGRLRGYRREREERAALRARTKERPRLF